MALSTTEMTQAEIAALQQAMTPRLNKFIPIKPTAKQTAALLLNAWREMLYGGAAGGGKDIDIYTPVLTFNRGWQTMETLKVGDYVFSITGKPTEVIQKSEVMHNACYRLTFDKGREEFITGKDHEWVVWRRRQDRKERVLERQTTEQLFCRFDNNNPRNRGSLYAIRNAAPLGYATSKLPMDPYVFGVWLGDGNRQSGSISSVDDEIQQQFMDRDYDVYFTESCIQFDRPDIHPEGRLHHWCSKRLRDELRQLGFLYDSYAQPVEKYVPEVFMHASYNDRLELLRGMMDTDGCAVDRPTGDVELTLANGLLATQLEELIRGLGIQVESKWSEDIRPDNSRYPKGTYVRYRLNWTTGVPMFHLTRKLAKQAKKTPETAAWHYISNIESVETVPTQCIQVADSPNVYLIGKTLIPTHNSVLLLTAALQYVDIPRYNAVLLRKTFSDLMLPGALIPMSQDWLSPWMNKGLVTWKDKEKKYIFEESGATLSFGYLENKGDHLRYQGSEFQFVGVDECTHIIPESYRYMFSRMRRLKGSQIPIRFRASANPGGPYGEYYYDRFFVDNLKPDGTLRRIFLQAGLQDNPHLDADEYRESLAELDDITREQLENGNWEIKPKGDLFDKEWLLTIEHESIPTHIRCVRFWDLAAIDPKYRKKNTNTREPDWTVGFKLGYANGIYYILDIIKVQKRPGDVEDLIYRTTVNDGYSCAVVIEQEGGQSGIANIERYAKLLQGYIFSGSKPVTSKYERARPVASACQLGNVFISNRCRNLLDFYTQLDAFPNGVKDDIIDGFSGAFSYFKANTSNVSAPTKQVNKYIKPTYAGSYWRSNSF